MTRPEQNMQQTPRWITVVIPTRDRPALLRQAVDSVLAQDGVDVVVVDDSDPPARGVVGVDHCEARVSVVGGGGNGPARARNTGAGFATTDWLAFLDDDDRLLPGGLGHVRQALDNESRKIGMVFCAVDLRRGLDGYGELALPVDLGPAFHSARGQLLAGGFCVRREVFESVGGYEPSLRFSENTEFVLRAIDHCAAHGLATLSIDNCLASIWQRDPNDRSSNSPRRVKEAANFMLTRHAEAFSRDPATAASFHRVAGVSAARLRERRQALAHFRAARALSATRKDRLRSWVLHVPVAWRVAWRPAPARPFDVGDAP